MGYSMASRNNMRYSEKEKMDKEYPDTLIGNIKLTGSAIKTFLTGGSPTQPPKRKR
jgi:hypothetical protein